MVKTQSLQQYYWSSNDKRRCSLSKLKISHVIHGPRWWQSDSLFMTTIFQMSTCIMLSPPISMLFLLPRAWELNSLWLNVPHPSAKPLSKPGYSRDDLSHAACLSLYWLLLLNDESLLNGVLHFRDANSWAFTVGFGWSCCNDDGILEPAITSCDS